jgi:hypothetical protein
MSKSNKPWYKKWWGIILAVIFWPYFLIWFMWAKSKRKLPTKIISTAILAALVFFSAWAFLLASGTIGQSLPSDTSQASTNPTPATPTTQPVSQPTQQKSTVSLGTLNSEAVAALSPELTDLSSQMATGQADASQDGASDYGSSFNTWSQNEKDSQNVTNNKNVTKAYNTADNAYYNAHQTAPAALDSWNTDTGAVVSDITQWADAQETVFADQAGGDPSQSNDQQTVNTDYQQFQSDLAKAQADIQQI